MRSLVFKKIRHILLDVEGTVSDMHFVKDVLFPYSARFMQTFLDRHHHDEDVHSILKEVPGDSLTSKVDQLQLWIRNDVKAAPLKELQGRIWRMGFESSEFSSPIYSDVLLKLNEWKEKGLHISIYSSGSVAAQKLFFQYTDHGNLLKFFSHHFDLKMGSKKEAFSYGNICKQLNCLPSHILFLSDIEAELVAAQSLGLKVAQVVRPGTKPSAKVDYVYSFADIEVSTEN